MRALLFALSVAMTAPFPASAQMLDFENLDGWAGDNHRAALTSFLETCTKLEEDWQPLCRLAADANSTDASARAFFELFFKPVIIGDPPALFTGYYEPEIAGVRQQQPGYDGPVYALPPDLVRCWRDDVPEQERTGRAPLGRFDERGQCVDYYDRTQIEEVWLSFCFVYAIISSRRLSAMSMSMSGALGRSGLRKRSKGSLYASGFTLVILRR